MQSTVDWFRIYKQPAGKPMNKFAFDGKAQSKVHTWPHLTDSCESRVRSVVLVCW